MFCQSSWGFFSAFHWKCNFSFSRIYFKLDIIALVCVIQLWVSNFKYVSMCCHHIIYTINIHTNTHIYIHYLYTHIYMSANLYGICGLFKVTHKHELGAGKFTTINPIKFYLNVYYFSFAFFVSCSCSLFFSIFPSCFVWLFDLTVY